MDQFKVKRKQVSNPGSQHLPPIKISLLTKDDELIYEYVQTSGDKCKRFEQIQSDGSIHVWYFGGESYYDELFVNLTTGNVYTTKESHPDVVLGRDWMWGTLIPNHDGTLVAVVGCRWGGEWTYRVYDVSDIPNKGWRNEYPFVYSADPNEIWDANYTEQPTPIESDWIEFPEEGGFWDDNNNFVIRRYNCYDIKGDDYCDNLDTGMERAKLRIEKKPYDHIEEYWPADEDIEIRLWEEGVYQLIDGNMVEISRTVHSDLVQQRIEQKEQYTKRELQKKETCPYYSALLEWKEKHDHLVWHCFEVCGKSGIQINLAGWTEGEVIIGIAWQYKPSDSKEPIKITQNKTSVTVPRSLPVPELLDQLDELLAYPRATR